MRPYIGIAACVAVALQILFASSVLAISMPSTVDIVVQQGEAQHEEIFVEHRGVDVVSVELSLKHVSFTEDGTPLLGLPADDVSWVQISSKTLSLAAGERSSVRVSVSPSVDMPSGSYVFGVLGIALQDGVFTLQHGVTTLIFITVGSPQVYEECLEFLRQKDDGFFLTLRNAGQGILYEEGDVALRGPFNIAFASTEGNPSFRRIFSGQTRSWTTEPLTIPWWAFGPMEYSFESSSPSSPCLPISAGFGYRPFVLLPVIAIGIFVWRRRR